MEHSANLTNDVLVIGAGPAGVVAALRAADLGAKTMLVARGEFGGMAANDGPIPVRTLAHAARLMRDARQLGAYGIRVSGIALDYRELLERVRDVVADARAHSSFRDQLESLGVVVRERAGGARFTGARTVETGDGTRIRAGKIIVCTGGVSRRLDVPGAALTSTHSDAWSLEAVPASMLVIGGGATGAQVASVFGAFGTRVQLYHSGPRILPTEDEAVSAAVAVAFRESGIEVHEAFGKIESFERTPAGIKMTVAKDGVRRSAEAALAVVAVAWAADTAELAPAAAGVELDERGFIRVDSHLKTTGEHVYAAGDVTGRLMLVPQAVQDGFLAATNAVKGPLLELDANPAPIGSFTDPEYAQVGLTEVRAREAHDVATALLRFDTATRTIIDGRKQGFCKLVVDRGSRKMLGCHVVGERAVEIAQLAAVAMAGGLTIDALARVPLSFPTYAGILGRVAARAAHGLRGDVAPELEAAHLHGD
jgi:dihydrolipoamide dehydrogenase